jgi:hypothetical protein
MLRALRTVEELTTAWLSGALGQRVHRFDATPIGTGQSSATYRVTFEGAAGMASVILKLAHPDPAVRRTGVVTGHSEREVRFYRELAGRLPDAVLARCHGAAYEPDGGHFTLLLEDLSPARTGDQITGCTPAQACTVVRELARLVAAVAEDPDLASWLDESARLDRVTLQRILPIYDRRFGAHVSVEHRDVVERFVACYDTWLADRPGPLSVVHGDFRLDNMLFGGATRELAVVDWATLAWGPVTSDVAYFIGGSLTLEDRRSHEADLVRAYQEELLAGGLRGITFEDCWNSYRWMSFTGVFMAVVAPLVVTATERGDRMFMTMLERHCQQVIDLDALAALEHARRRAVTVNPADEDRHQPGTERYWNESWYMDALSADGTLGAYVRIGYAPNLGNTVYAAYIVGKGRPSVAILDHAAPLPPEGLIVTTERFTSGIVIEEPLQRLRVTLTGIGEAYADSSAPLRSERGTPVDVELDLVWTADGRPYMYDVTDRYELPCTVSGTIRLGREVLTLDGPGQRDHSWGDRNWFAHDWCWASAHLDDGTHLQVVELRLPRVGVIGAGYEQRSDRLTEITGIGAAYEIATNREPGRTQVSLEPTGTRAEWTPIAYGSLRIDSPDGLVCEFPRAMARVKTVDGRVGLGWLEWGTNVDRTAGGASRPLGAALRGLRAGLATLGRGIPQSAIDRVMSSKAGPTLVAAILRALSSRMDHRRVAVADATLRFTIGDGVSDTVDAYDLNLSRGRPPAVTRHPRGTSTSALPPARATLTMGAGDFIAFALGRLDAIEAALQRRLVVDGDMQFVATVIAILSGDAFPPPRMLGPPL